MKKPNMFRNGEKVIQPKFRACLYCGFEPKQEPSKDGYCYKCGKRGLKTVYAKGELPEENTKKIIGVFNEY